MSKSTDCTTPRRPVMRGINHAERRAVFFRPRCKKWSCPFCAEINRSLWAVRAFHGAETFISEGIAIDFLTLTSHEKLSADASIRVLPHAWDQLNKRTRRMAPSYQYLLIPERHQDGRLHLHAIETSGLGTRWYKDNARACGFGFIAEESELRSPAGAGAYVVKYITKTIADLHWPIGFRRVRTSRQWPTLPPLPPLEEWSFIPLPHDEDIQQASDRLVDQGYEVKFLGSMQAWEFVMLEH